MEGLLQRALNNELVPTPKSTEKPIKFTDAVGRKFTFPFELCKTWAVSPIYNWTVEFQLIFVAQGIDELIQQAFSHVDVVGPQVRAGRFDLIAPNGDMILKGQWESLIQPDWTIAMSMWPIPERKPMVRDPQC